MQHLESAAFGSIEAAFAAAGGDANFGARLVRTLTDAGRTGSAGSVRPTVELSSAPAEDALSPAATEVNDRRSFENRTLPLSHVPGSGCRTVRLLSGRAAPRTGSLSR